MKLRWKYSPALAAAAVALACGVPGAYAVTSGSFGGTATYASQTVASNGNVADIPSGGPGSNLHYTTSFGTGLATGATITWTSTGSATAFAGSVNARCDATTIAGIANCAAAGFPPVTGVTLTPAGNTIVLPIPAPGLPAVVGNTYILTLVSTSLTGTFSTTVTGLANLGPGAATTSSTANTVLLGTPSSTPPAIPTFGAGSVGDLITVQAASGGAGESDANPLPAFFLTSSSIVSINVVPVDAYVDLTNATGCTTGAGTCFQHLTAGSAGNTVTASLVGYLGTIVVTNLDGLIDARTGSVCCTNAITATTPFANTVLPFNGNVTVTGDFQTITTAFLRPGNNLASLTGNQTAGATPNIEAAPSATTGSPCSTSAQTGDINSTPQPTASLPTLGTTLTFTLPNMNVAVNGSIGVNPVTYALCIVTNGSNIIPDTVSNAPGVSGPINVNGGVASGTTATITAQFTSLANVTQNLGTVGAQGGGTNAHLFGNVRYAGTKAQFPNVFPSSSGFPTWFRIVNTGLGRFPIFGLLQKDGGTPINIPGSFMAIDSFSTAYVLADSIAAQGGQTLASHNTMTLLTPASPGSVSITRMTGEPSGDIVLTPAGL
jgi:hypothetical protein